ncbi:ATP-dependent helicase [Microbacterium esteraromaticum]|uniref:ATP-dependent helicase n=1 Tax=Microbacterium esteraromaticum TaxID=57043 RepID=UPI0019D35418|nr:ATP-dependent DNA helicase [Microbacterium esteraromaticum]MBN7793050.1 ATP-dependent helicase [Microbacterium esteraromaticum]MCA1305837.1 ATP-dependent helicase [Microbacterium esteraromaticum]
MTQDAAQRALVDAPAATSGVVIGAPGTGKTTALVDRVVHLLDSGLRPEQMLVLTPSRQAATVLRDRIGVRIDQATPGPLARSLASFAFQIVRGVTVHRGDDPPALLTGADQDRIFADLLAGDAEDGLREWPEALSPGVRASKAFRSELRAFLAECTELAVEPGELERSGRATWQAAAGFLDEYRDVMGGMRVAHRDIPELLGEATGILHTADAASLGPLAQLRVVLIDDAQELTRGGIRLVRALRAREIAVLAFGDPDISSGAFRGASPQLFADLVQALGEVFVLDRAHRQSPDLTALTRTITQAIGVAGRVDHRRPPEATEPVVGDRTAGVRTLIAPSPYEEVDRIAATLREWHLTDGIPWSGIAVIAHDTRQIVMLEAELAAREVPTRAAGVPRPLGSERIVREITEVVRLGLTAPEDREADLLAELLTSPFGGLDAVGLRRLRARLRHVELEDGGSTPARELLREAMQFPVAFDRVDAAEARVAQRFAHTLAQVHEEAAAGATVHELLWTVWDRARTIGGTPLQNAWRAAADQPGGAEVARSLDSLVALFAAAKRFVERTPHEKAALFIRDILDSEVPEDTLSTPERPGLVTLMTPATALGAEFEAVVVAGVQDGIWPNVRLRGGMLETWRLAEAITAARDGLPEEVPGILDRRRAALHDELRLFVRAVSRARTRLVVTAVDDDDMSPSPFFSFLPPAPPVEHDEERYAHPLTLRGLVARHRRALSTTDDPADLAHAAGQLRVLAESGVPGAAPDEWYGLTPPSTTAPLRDLDAAPVRVSPSRLEAFEECGLNWVISSLGGDTVAPPSAGIGTIVHEAMEKVPDGALDAMQAIVDEHWPELDFETAWIGRKERRRADLYVERVHDYVGEVARDGGRVVGAEARFRFTVDLETGRAQALPTEPAADATATTPGGADATVIAERPRALVSGVIDRVEVYPVDGGEHAPARGQKWQRMGDGDGEQRVIVVDLKTGKYEPDTEANVLEHAQLAAYQVAVQEGLLDDAPAEALAGARLVIVSKTVGKANYRVAHQHTLDDDARAAFLRRVADAGRGMAASSFTAQVETHCADTQVRVTPCHIHTVPAVSA